MRIGLRIAFGVGTCGVALFAITATAWALAAPPCVAAKVLPSAPVVPANLPGFAYTALKATSSDVHLFNTSSGRVEVPLTIDTADGFLKLTPPTVLLAGASYELVYSPY